MSQTRIRQIARLEKLAQPYIKQRQQTEREWRTIRQGAAAHAATLAFLIRYGNPKIDKPLSVACQKFIDSSAWNECCDRFPTLRRRSGQNSFKRFNRNQVLIIGTCLRHAVISSFPGADEKEKLDAVFALAPPWLLWFTFADYTAELLGLHSTRSFERDRVRAIESDIRPLVRIAESRI